MSSSRKTDVFITSDFGCEVAITALARFLSAGAAHENLSLRSLSSPNYVKCVLFPSLDQQYPEGFDLYLFGDFWLKPVLIEALEERKVEKGEERVTLYTFDRKVHVFETIYKSSGFERGSWSVVEEGEEVGGPLHQVVKFIKSNHTLTPVEEFVLKHHSEFIQMLDARALGLKVEETQALFSGLCDSSSESENSLEEKIYQIFCGKIDLEDVMKIGTTIVKNQRDIARERALKNARSGTFVDGTRYVLTNAPEFVNLSHDQLRKQYPEMQVTICAKLSFEEGQPDSIHHSLRSWDKTVSVKKIIGSRGGGSDTAAGGATEIDVKIDY